jgi:hypothetical protein
LAKDIWAQKVLLDVIGAPESERTAFLASVADEEAISISEVTGVWCIVPTIDDVVVLVHIVKTDTGSMSEQGTKGRT